MHAVIIFSPNRLFAESLECQFTVKILQHKIAVYTLYEEFLSMTWRNEPIVIFDGTYGHTIPDQCFQFSIGIFKIVSHPQQASRGRETLISMKMDPAKLLELAFKQLEARGMVYRTTADSVLSKRELQIIDLISKGVNTREIAQILHLSSFTVETHRRNIHRKMGTRNVSELLRKAYQQGVLNYKSGLLSH